MGYVGTGSASCLSRLRLSLHRLLYVIGRGRSCIAAHDMITLVDA